MKASEAEAITQKLAELTFVTGSQTRDRLNEAIARLEAGALSFGFMVREGVIYNSADSIVAMMLSAIQEIQSATSNLCNGLDELVDDESYADWVESNGNLDVLGYTREQILRLRTSQKEA